MSTVETTTLACHAHECPKVFVGNFRETKTSVVKRARRNGWRVGWFFTHCPEHVDRPDD